MHVSSPLSTLIVWSKKTPVKLEMSGGNIEAMGFPSISGKDNSMDSLLLSVQGDLRSHG